MTQVRCNMVFAGILLSWLVQAQAEVYRWVDEKGQVHFGDQPAGVASQQIRTPSAPGAAGTDQQKRMEKTRKLLNAYEIERQQEREQKAKQKQEAEHRKRNCVQARDDLRQYTDFGNIYRLDEEGNRVYLSERERQSRLERSRQDVERWCN